MKHEKQLANWLGEAGPASVVAGLADLCDDAAVFVVDAQRRVLLWSRGAEGLLGFSADEVVGEHCLKSNRCQECMRGCGIAEHGEVRGVPLTLYRKDGVPVRVRKHAFARLDADGSFAGGVELLMRDRAAPAPRPVDPTSFHGIVSGDPQMQQVYQVIRNVAETTANVLVRGESGTGKELVARAIHAESTRHGGPFVAVNCASLTPTLMESELFGHKKGAFTGAVSDRVGIFEQAHGGTLFLDEVAELPIELQAKLLRVLEDHAVVRVGSNERIAVDVRIVAATHRSLRERVRTGRFREDLMYRLRVVPIFLPPLRKRPGDVELLLWHFVGRRNLSGSRIVERIAPEAMRRLLEHSWPGNVRELKNVIEYAFAVGRGAELLASELPPELRPDEPDPVLGSDATPVDPEAARLRRALEATGGDVGRAAELLGMSRPTFWRKRKKHGLE